MIIKDIPNIFPPAAASLEENGIVFLEDAKLFTDGDLLSIQYVGKSTVRTLRKLIDLETRPNEFTTYHEDDKVVYGYTETGDKVAIVKGQPNRYYILPSRSRMNFL